MEPGEPFGVGSSVAEGQPLRSPHSQYRPSEHCWLVRQREVPPGWIAVYRMDVVRLAEQLKFTAQQKIFILLRHKQGNTGPVPWDIQRRLVTIPFSDFSPAFETNQQYCFIYLLSFLYSAKRLCWGYLANILAPNDHHLNEGSLIA